jgi:hypothetical protein
VGLFFDNRAASSDLVDLIQKAFDADPPAPGTAQQQAATLAGQLHPLAHALTGALASPPLANAADSAVQARATAQATVNQLLGGASLNTGRFLVALAIFAALVGGGVATAATHLATASGTLFGFAGAFFGVATAFLGTEKGSS